jgi:hypothetical protein
MWGGAATKTDVIADQFNQTFVVYGTGLDEENYTIIMDFWREDAVAIGFDQ